MKRFKSILQLILPYISIIVLTMVSIGYLGGRLADSYKDRIIEKKQMNLEVAMERFQDTLDDATQLVHNIENNSAIKNYVYEFIRRDSISTYECMAVQKELYNYKHTSNVVNIFLYDLKRNRIIDAETIFSDVEDYFNYNYTIHNLTPEEYIERLKDPEYEGYSEAIALTHGKWVSQYIEYKIKIPFGWSSENALQLVITMDAGNLFGDFYDVMEGGSEFYVYDEDGRLIYNYGNRFEHMLDESQTEFGPISDKEQNYGVVYQSGDRQWYIKFIYPDFLSNVHLPYFELMVVVPVIAAVLLSILFTYKNYREITGVVCMLNLHFGTESKKVPKKSGYVSIKESVAILVDENSKYRERIEDFSFAHRAEILGRLVRNAYGSREEINSALKEIDFCNWESCCVVLCIRYEGSDYRRIIDENVSIKDLIREVIPRFADGETEIFDSAARETVCIMFPEEGINREAAVRKLSARLNVEVFYAYDIDAKIGAGNIVDSIYAAADSYKQAKEVIKYRETVGSNVYLYSDLKQREDSYYYPPEFDELIYNYIVAGKADNAKDILGRLYSENMERTTGMLSVTAIEMMRKRLESGMMSLAKKYHIDVERFHLAWQREQNISKYFELMYEFIDWIAEEIGGERECVQNRLGVKILDYVNKHYSDNSLSLKQISKEFGFQENYASRMFKSAYGENLSTVIERIRIDKACELLKNAEMKIGDISVLVGYSSDISFRRAFKKVTGMTPQEYREAKNSSNE